MISIHFRNLKTTDRIFIGWDSWNGYSQNLEWYLRKNGCTNVKDFSYDEDIAKKEGKQKEITLFQRLFYALQGLFLFFRYDAFFFFHGQSLFFPVPFRIDRKHIDYLNFFRYFDLWFFRIFHKKVYLVFQGADIRDYAIDIPQKTIPRTSYASDHYLKSIYRALPLAENILISTPDLFLHVPEKFRSKTIWGPKLITLPTIQGIDTFHNAIHIFHAPSNPIVKGTIFIQQAIQILQKNNPKIQLVCLQNVPNQQVLETALSCFCVIDQVLGTFAYGHFAMEMMALKIPVMTYFLPQTLQKIANLTCPLLPLPTPSLPLQNI